MLQFFQGQDDQCLANLRMANSLNPFNALVLHSSGFLTCMLGHWEEGLSLSKQAFYLTPHHYSLYFIVPFMDIYYRQKDYEAAWNYAKRVNSPIFWGPLIQAAAAGQLGLHTPAKAALQELLEMRPDFPSRARDLLRRVVYLEDHINLLLDGLLKAGLDITS